MQITITADIKEVQIQLDKAGKQARYAGSQAINDSAFNARAAVQREMDSKFDRVTPYIRRSVFVTQSKPETLLAVMAPKYQGGKGVDPQKVLQAEVFGGSRRQKAIKSVRDHITRLYLLTGTPDPQGDLFWPLPSRTCWKK